MGVHRSGEKRPELKRVKSGAELLRWYWLKSELLTFAKANGLPVSGNKPELQARIARWLDTGQVVQPKRPRRAESTFDWGRARLSTRTVITDSYRNTQNVREFMKRHAGAKFAFSNEFMGWMRSNAGKTLADAIAFWRELDRKKREEGYREASLPQNQYAKFSRALARARPGISAAEIRRIWKVKRAMPSPPDRPGTHEFRPGDENL